MAEKEKLADNTTESTEKKRKRKNVTPWDIVTFIIVILALGGGLALSYLLFDANSYTDKAERGAHGVYAAVQSANISLGSIDNSDKLLAKLKESNPDLIATDASHSVSGEAITLCKGNADGTQTVVSPLSLKEGDSMISPITVTGAGFNFTYYKFMNGKIYLIEFTEGILGDVSVYEIN